VDFFKSFIDRLRSAKLASGSIAIFSAGAVGGKYAAQWNTDFQSGASWLCILMMCIGLLGVMLNLLKSVLLPTPKGRISQISAASNLPKPVKQGARVPRP